MSTGFEFLEGTVIANPTTTRLTIRKAGQLALTEAAVAMLGEGVEPVQIGYNAKTRVVGIRPAADDVRGALKLRAQPNGRSRLVDAKRRFAHRGLALDKARSLAVETSAAGSWDSGSRRRGRRGRRRRRRRTAVAGSGRRLEADASFPVRLRPRAFLATGPPVLRYHLTEPPYLRPSWSMRLLTDLLETQDPGDHTDSWVGRRC